jgi:hypothetical protein
MILYNHFIGCVDGNNNFCAEKYISRRSDVGEGGK